MQVRHRDRTMWARGGSLVVGDLAKVAVWVLEIAGLTAVEGFSRCLRYLGSGIRRLGQQQISLGPRPEAAPPAAADGDPVAQGALVASQPATMKP
jgi:hypothetical protein